MIYAGWRLGLTGAAGKSVSGAGPEHDSQARLPCCGGYLTESLAFFPQASSEDGASVSWTLMASSSPPAQPAVGTVPQGPGGMGELGWLWADCVLLAMCPVSPSASGSLFTRWSPVFRVNARHLLIFLPVHPRSLAETGSLGTRTERPWGLRWVSCRCKWGLKGRV